MTPSPVWVLTGPTASGKTAFGLDLAERGGAEIVSMDSMAVYRRMEIGTAKPSASERARVRHWGIDVVGPDETFDTARWCKVAEDALADARRRGVQLLFVGGTPLYLMAFFKGMVETPPKDDSLRARLAARHAAEPGALHAELLERDPASAAWIHRNDEKRLVRALEVLAVVDFRAGEILEAQRVDQKRDTLVGKFRVTLLDLLVEGEAVLEAGAAAAGHEHPQFEPGIALLTDQLADLAGGGVSEFQAFAGRRCF